MRLELAGIIQYDVTSKGYDSDWNSAMGILIHVLLIQNTLRQGNIGTDR